MRLVKRSLRDRLAAWVDMVRVLSASPVITRSIIDQFREAGATTPSAAQPFRAHSPAEENAFRYLLSIGALLQSSPGRYYLDEASIPTLRRQFLLPWWW